MEQFFKNWLLKQGYSKTGAPNSYSRAISKISEHYSKNTRKTVDIYSIKDQMIINQIAYDYSQYGKYSDFGYEQHGRYRAAISKYLEFFAYKNQRINEGNTEISEETPNISGTEIRQNNFVYEKDLQTTFFAQISELFPNYKIYGESNVGIEYSIGGRIIDVLLEQTETGNLLVVELKSGVADLNVFGQISMYLGLLKNKFPNKVISGVIVAGTIEDSLKQACEITDLIKLKIYRMSIKLESV